VGKWGMGGEGRRGKGRTGEKKEGGREGGRKGEDDCYSKLFRPCVGLTAYCYAVYESTRSGPFATRLSVCPSVCLSVTLMCCAQTTKRIKLPIRVRVTPSIDIIVLHGGPDPPKNSG